MGAGKVGSYNYCTCVDKKKARNENESDLVLLLQSSLLQLLIKELSSVSGSVVVEGKVSYASQEPWVFSGTLRENILFGLPYKPKWYQKVIEACSLDKVNTFVRHFIDL